MKGRAGFDELMVRGGPLGGKIDVSGGMIDCVRGMYVHGGCGPFAADEKNCRCAQILLDCVG